jgi:hypothetical protein
MNSDRERGSAGRFSVMAALVPAITERGWNRSPRTNNHRYKRVH